MNPTSNESYSTFCQACDAGSVHLNFLEDDGNVGESRLFDPPFLVVGRSPDSDLRLDHDQVSWRHCYLQVIGGRLVTVDLDSLGGVLIDGVPHRIGWVTPANRLQIGPVSFQFQGRDEDALGTARVGEPRVHPLSAQYARNLPTAALEIEGGGGQTFGWRMSRSLALIGRSPSCQVRLMNSSISKFHAALVRTPAGVWIVDLLSREGIEVDGVNVRLARLDEGMVCRLGTFTLRFCRGTLAPAPPRRVDRGRALPAPTFSQGANVVSSPIADGRSVLLASPGGATTTPLTPAPSWSAAPLAKGPDHRPSWNPPEEPGFDPSQQAMMMLAQMLGTMHRDHMSLVKDELAEIRKLAEEMHALRVEIAQRPSESPAPALAPAAPAPASPAPVAASASARLTPAETAVPVPGPHPGLVPESVSVPVSEPVESLAPVPPRDPKECLTIASQFLASYERKQEGHWSRILRVVAGVTRNQEPGRGSLEQAPLG